MINVLFPTHSFRGEKKKNTFGIINEFQLDFYKNIMFNLGVAVVMNEVLKVQLKFMSNFHTCTSSACELAEPLCEQITSSLFSHFSPK